MPNKPRPSHELEAGIMVYLTVEQRQRLHEVLKQEGVYSASSWLRQMIIRKLREANLEA